MIDRYQDNYKYGYKIGKYEGCCNTVLNFFKDLHELEFNDKKQKIKWLSNYELELLRDLLIDEFCYIRSAKKEEEKLKILKSKVLEMVK